MINIFQKTIGLNLEHGIETEEFYTLDELKEKLKNSKNEEEREKINKMIEKRLKTLDIGESCVDDSHFIPQSELVKRGQKTMALGNDQIEGLYDFADGKDTGMKAPISRKNKNVIEIISEIKTQQKDLNKTGKDIINLENQKIKE